MLKNDLSIEAFVMQLRNIADHLATIGEPVTHCDILLYAINGLDSNYNDFVSSFMVWNNEVTFDEFNCQLLTYEHWLEQQDLQDANRLHHANVTLFAGIGFKNQQNSNTSKNLGSVPWNL